MNSVNVCGLARVGAHTRTRTHTLSMRRESRSCVRNPWRETRSHGPDTAGHEAARGWQRVKGKCPSVWQRSCLVQTSKGCFREGQFLGCVRRTEARWPHSKAPRTAWRLRNLAGAAGPAAGSPFQLFKPTRRLPVSGLRRAACGGGFQAPGVGTDTAVRIGGGEGRRGSGLPLTHSREEPDRPPASGWKVPPALSAVPGGLFQGRRGRGACPQPQGPDQPVGSRMNRLGCYLH